MNKIKLYKAFGLTIASELPIPQLPIAEDETADVRIVRADLSALTSEDVKSVFTHTVIQPTTTDTFFRITGGDIIEADVAENDTEDFVAMYLMGSCMGAILVQRGFMLLHGSCITDGKRSILITGDSGAGKSTLAAEFLKRGWKLLTDDVTCVFDRDGVPMVQSSYPSQKLWQDALDHYEKSSDDIHSLYFSEDREKFGIDVSESFFDGICPLSMVVRLLPANYETHLTPMEGMAKVDQLMRNTYRMYLIEKRHLQRHFQRCVSLAGMLPMALAVRENGKQCADTICDLIINYLEEQSHD